MISKRAIGILVCSRGTLSAAYCLYRGLSTSYEREGPSAGREGCYGKRRSCERISKETSARTPPARAATREAEALPDGGERGAENLDDRGEGPRALLRLLLPSASVPRPTTRAGASLTAWSPVGSARPRGQRPKFTLDISWPVGHGGDQ